MFIRPLGRGESSNPRSPGLKQAYFGSGNGDWAVVSERKVRAGDTILVHAGLYKGDRLQVLRTRSASTSTAPTC